MSKKLFGFLSLLVLVVLIAACGAQPAALHHAECRCVCCGLEGLGSVAGDLELSWGKPSAEPSAARSSTIPKR